MSKNKNTYIAIITIIVVVLIVSVFYFIMNRDKIDKETAVSIGKEFILKNVYPNITPEQSSQLNLEVNETDIYKNGHYWHITYNIASQSQVLEQGNNYVVQTAGGNNRIFIEVDARNGKASFPPQQGSGFS